MATTSSRESRRRRILERGSDRLAFITGNLQNLPPHSDDQIDGNNPPPPLAPHGQDSPPELSSQIAVSTDVRNEASSPVLLKQNPSSDADRSQTNSYNGGIGEGSTSNRRGTSIKPSNESAFDTSGETNSLPVSSDDQSSLLFTSRMVQISETQTRKHNLFTPKQISSAIDASEKTRILCSVIVAVLVVFLHLGFPLLGNKLLGSVISFRPLYFILLTNITLVMGRLVFGDHPTSRRPIEIDNKGTSTDDYNWAEQLSKTLEHQREELQRLEKERQAEIRSYKGLMISEKMTSNKQIAATSKSLQELEEDFMCGISSPKTVLLATENFLFVKEGWFLVTFSLHACSYLPRDY